MNTTAFYEDPLDHISKVYLGMRESRVGNPVEVAGLEGGGPESMIGTSHRGTQRPAHQSAGIAVLVGLAICALLWVLYVPYRESYLLNSPDIPALADGLLLAPGARWQHWFSRGYTHFFDLYPEWPYGVTGFTRPAFQFLIYLSHFALGRDWASYQVINCFAVAGMSALAFYIANAALGLRTGLSILASVMVVLSPPVLNSWLLGVAYADEPLATVFVAGAFIAVAARRDFTCLLLLFAGLCTKENAVWAPVAAAATIILQPKPDEPLQHRVFTAAIMFLPIMMWLGLRFAFFGGIGGTYGTAGYSPLVDFLKLIFDKLTHMHYLFITHAAEPNVLDRGIGLLVYVLLSLWAFRIVQEVISCSPFRKHEAHRPTVGGVFVLSLWAGLALVFHFALPLPDERYATSVVVFAWPVVIAEVERRRKTIVPLGLAVCCVVSVIRSSHRYMEWISHPSAGEDTLMIAALRQVPTSTRQVYVLSSSGTQYANPEYVRLILGVPAEIVRIADVNWNCNDSNELVAFNYTTADAMVDMTITLPACARFRFLETNAFNGPKLANGRIYRSETMTYEVPQAHPIEYTKSWEPAFDLGRTMTVHARTNGPARFIIARGGHNGIVWFDIP